MSKKVWIIFVAACILLLGTLVAISNNKKTDVSAVDASTIQPATEQSGVIGDHVFGDADSKVVLIEYADFQCPGCGSVHPSVKNLTEKYKDQIAFVFRNYPITTIHPNARTAASAAEAAGLQGKYWEMNDLLFTNQAAWQNLSIDERVDFFADYANTLGLKVDTFKTDLASEAVAKKISYDQAIAQKIGVTGTPSFHLNGTVLEQPVWGDIEKFEAAIVAELKKNNIPLPDAAKE